jgi:hypothetical protein
MSRDFAGFYNLEETGWNWTYLNNSSPEGALQMFLRDIELSNIVSGMPKYTPIWVVRKTVISHAANFAPMPGPGQQKEFKAWCLQHIRLDCFWENSKYLLGFLGATVRAYRAPRPLRAASPLIRRPRSGTFLPTKSSETRPWKPSERCPNHLGAKPFRSNHE